MSNCGASIQEVRLSLAPSSQQQHRNCIPVRFHSFCGTRELPSAYPPLLNDAARRRECVESGTVGGFIARTSNPRTISSTPRTIAAIPTPARLITAPAKERIVVNAPTPISTSAVHTIKNQGFDIFLWPTISTSSSLPAPGCLTAFELPIPNPDNRSATVY